ncbi:MAG: cyclic nucleotide-binding domain-containing protein [Deltaproteobacteria bacterium]|nr:cyclic nucleotide-binding domain-containing protein [Deltaproteobacteria bacterium]
MYIQQSDLFWGMNRDFVKKVMNIAEKKSYGKGHFLFHEGDPAVNFYVLIKGQVKLMIGETSQMVYTVDRAGEAFGWSSIIERDTYSASGECMEETILQKIDSRALLNILEKDPVNGLIFIKRLAGLIGNRLVWSYKMITSSSRASVSMTEGTGQIEVSEAAA